MAGPSTCEQSSLIIQCESQPSAGRAVSGLPEAEDIDVRSRTTDLTGQRTQRNLPAKSPRQRLWPSETKSCSSATVLLPSAQQRRTVLVCPPLTVIRPLHLAHTGQPPAPTRMHHSTHLLLARYSLVAISAVAAASPHSLSHSPVLPGSNLPPWLSMRTEGEGRAAGDLEGGKRGWWASA